MNIADMPAQVARGLRARGHTAEQVHFHNGQGHAFNFKLDVAPNLKELGGRVKGHGATLKSYLDRDFDIYHFWNKTMFFDLYYNDMTGFDVPLIKARGKRVIHRFTGFDLRTPKKDKAVNPYSPHHQGYKHVFDERRQAKFIDFLGEYVDAFVVADPEMAQFVPGKANIVPRALDLTQWPVVGVQKTDKPLIVHAPSNAVVKGTPHILKAIEELRDEGLSFDFQLIERLSHQEAKDWYSRADIIVDQILIGATGVLTLEAWALGKPCVVNLRRDLFEPFYDTNDLPVANANPDTVKDVLRALIKDQEHREDLGKRGRALVEKYHDVTNVIPQYEELYYRVLDQPLKAPTGTADIDYLMDQGQLAASTRVKVNKLTKELTETQATNATLQTQVDTLTASLEDAKQATQQTFIQRIKNRFL